jgi:hypothetical protein
VARQKSPYAFLSQARQKALHQYNLRKNNIVEPGQYWWVGLAWLNLPKKAFLVLNNDLGATSVNSLARPEAYHRISSPLTQSVPKRETCI